AFDQDRSLLHQASPGLFWVAVLLCTLLAVQRSFAVESSDGAGDALRMSGLDPAGIFLGKVGAVAAELVGLELVLGGGVVVLFGTDVRGVAILVTSSLAATAGLAAAGVLYGVISAGLRVRETLLPLLFLPVAAPVLLGATEAWRSGLGLSADDGWRWLVILAAFAAVYLAIGVLAFGSLLEES
ncbi:MAG: heme exporter protein CcmB, partial [Acidimicrobiales bacterium]